MEREDRLMRSRSFAAALAVLVGVVGVGLVGAPAHAAPNTVRGYQWYLGPMKIAQAQQITRGAGVVVAVVDSPTDGDHPALSGRVLQGTGIGGPANGWGADAGAKHGTGMASLIAGKGGDDMTELGIAPDAKILPVAVQAGDQGGSRNLADGIRWAADHGAKVINVSQGGAHTPLPAEVDAVRYALSKDAVVVAPTGNTAQDVGGVISPASIPGVVAVSGVTESGDAWSGSTNGPETVVAAPAPNIIMAVPKSADPSGYYITDGTSNSTAITSGVIALIRAKYPQLNAANVINRLIKTARDNGDPGRDRYFGFGTIRPLDALTANVPEISQNPLVSDASGVPATSSGNAATPVAKSGASITPSAVLAIICVALVVLIVVVLIVVAATRRGRRRPAVPAGQPYPYPPGPPSPTGYGTPPAQGHGYGPVPPQMPGGPPPVPGAPGGQPPPPSGR
jgi:type VII secretion-associated serine protease mycosin